MEPIPDDYVVEEQEFEAYPDGKYSVKGMEWFTKDQEGRPILTAQKNGLLVGRLKFTLENGEAGPPMSLVLGEMPLLVMAFAGKEAVAKLPTVPTVNQAAKVSQYMAQVAELVNGANKVLKVKCEGGWTQNDFMAVPLGQYQFYLSNLGPVDKASGEVAPRDGQFGKFFFATFTITEGPFLGATFTELVNYAIEVIDGKPQWQRTDVSKQFTSSAAKLSKVMRLTAPNMFDDFSPPNPHNLLTFWKTFLDGTKHIITGVRAPDEKGRVRLLFQTLESTGKTVEGQPSVASAPAEDSLDDKARKALVQLLNHLGDCQSTKNGSYDLSEDGIKVAKQYLSPMRKTKDNPNGFLTTGYIDKLTYDEIAKVFSNLPDGAKDQTVKDLNVNLTGAGLGFEAEDENWLTEEETPF